MKDVARIAGVSTSTVSHVINKDRFVSEAITAKVDAAIKSLNYAPSALARSLKLNQTRTIGMLITASTNPFYSELVRGVERSCFERGYSLVLCNTEGDEQRMNRNLETLMAKTRRWITPAVHGDPSALPGNHAALSVGTDGYDGLGPL
ncbi:transcriptional repressor RbsR [Klebsiella pneumoniae subsp. ozaenae]|uniref:Transcriptional repressor RbsR n=1 Tax=Klebsiella pneumoniae subsp. ozaenae TaxID=574 RepID=A0A378AS75_KLEPO|nr:transcriptional repressor RbsR [Klebsiella pneumoniae subsp. ozaenae]